MSEPFIGEIVMFGGNFAPRSWAFCDGQLLAISSNTALFSILGTTYGGDGRTTFALPDLRGRVPLGPRTGPGLSPYVLGEKGGAERVTLSVTQIPSHNHPLGTSAILRADNDPPDGNTNPENQRLAASDIYGAAGRTTTVNMANTIMSGTTENAGGSQPHENRQPFLAINFIICLQGIYPSRS